MFRLDLHELIFTYTGLCLVVMLLAALLHNIRRHRQEVRARRNLVRCHFCALDFRDETDAELPICPACGATTDRQTLSRL